MKLAIVGSRTFVDYQFLKECLKEYKEITEIVSGGADGADYLAERYATEFNHKIIIFKADWNKNGRSAGFIRNKQIIDYADRIIAFWDGKSKGTANDIELAKKSKKECVVKLF